MKKIFSVLSTVILAHGVMCGQVADIDPDVMTNVPSTGICIEVPIGQRFSPMPMDGGFNMSKSMDIHKSSQSDNEGEVITSPEGEMDYFYRVSMSFVVFGAGSVYFGPFETTSDIIYGDDGYAYIRDPFVGCAFGSYLKCERQGSKLVAELPQKLYEQPNPDDPEKVDVFYATILQKETDGEGRITYVKTEPDECRTVSFTIDGDVITLDIDYNLTPDENGIPPYPDMVLGVVDQNGLWAGLGECMQRYEKEDINPVVIPDGLEFEEWEIVSTNPALMEGQFFKVSFDGDDVYLTDFSHKLPDACIKGTIEGDKVIFESHQYQGMVNGQFAYFMAASGDFLKYDFTDRIEFDYDADAHTMTSAPQSIMLFIYGKENIRLIIRYMDPLIKVRGENPDPTPVMPILSQYQDRFKSDGYTYFSFYLPALNSEYDILDTSDMYYQIYLDDETYTFYADEYGLEEDMEQLPYDFSNGDSEQPLTRTIYASGEFHGVHIYVTGYDVIGVQYFNKKDGNIYPSQIMNVNATTGQVSNEVKEISADSTVTGLEFYDLNGLRLNRPARGINICRTIFEDGTVSVSKLVVK